MHMKCSFCINEIERGTGKIFAQNDARIFYFCSSKCQKGQFKLKHKGWETKWTETFRTLKAKEGAGAVEPTNKKETNAKQ